MLKIFLSGIEQRRKQGKAEAQEFLDRGINFKWNLMSYYYVRHLYKVAELVRDNSQLVLIDSGAHSFQKGAKVCWDQYTHEYASFIQKFDRPNVLGFFEMDVDNILGYPKVLELRKILESVSDKIIPVWHKNRGINDFKKMCSDYSGKIVAITGFKNEDIKDEQYLMFVKYAKSWNCKIHCLGMTRKAILDKVPFDFVDSSSWAQQGVYGKIGNRKVTRNMSKERSVDIFYHNYLIGQKLQDQYYKKWIKVNGV